MNWQHEIVPIGKDQNPNADAHHDPLLQIHDESQGHTQKKMRPTESEQAFPRRQCIFDSVVEG